MGAVFLNDGRVIKDEYDLRSLLESFGVVHDCDMDSIHEMLCTLIGVRDDVESAIDKANEYEMIADEYKQNMDGLCDEVRAIADNLISEKRGQRYTKVYLGNALLNAVRQYEI